MNKLNKKEVCLSNINWEPDNDSALPLHEESIRLAQNAIQSRITSTSCIDQDEDWSDVRLSFDLTGADSRLLKFSAKGRSHKSEFSRPREYEAGLSRKKLKQFDDHHIFRFFDLLIRLVGAIAEFIIRFTIKIFGVKNFRKRSRKRRVIAKNYKRHAGSTQRKIRQSKKAKTLIKPINLASNWKKVDEPFVPSSNLYCYWCTKKLGLKLWELDGHYFCDSCRSSKNINL